MRPSPQLLFSMAAMPPISRTSTLATRATQARSTRLAGVLQGLKDESRKRRREGRRAVLAAPGLAARREWRTGFGARRRLAGDRGRRSATRSRKGAGARRRAQRRGCPAGDPRFDPRLMLIRAYRMRGHLHANLDPLGLAATGRRGRPRSGAPTASPTPTSTARSSSTMCSASSSRRCARCSRFCGAPIARRSASSSCTSPIRRRRAGSRSASKGRTRRSPSPARASARSSTSWSRRKASRSSST